MSTDYSSDELSAFLDWGVQKGLLKQQTGKSRKIAAQKILSALDASEREDLRSIDVASTFSRFVNKFAKDFTPQSLATYKSRFQSALDDFMRYKESPSTFRFEGQRDKRALDREVALSDQSHVVRRPRIIRASRAVSKVMPQSLGTQGSVAPVSEVVFPIPIRDGTVVRVHNLPSNLTKAEAQRISAVIMALAMPD
jgi:hypothetical protein